MKKPTKKDAAPRGGAKPMPRPSGGARVENLAVRVSAELLAALTDVAAEEERSKSQMAEIILRRWLQDKGKL